MKKLIIFVFIIGLLIFGYTAISKDKDNKSTENTSVFDENIPLVVYDYKDVDKFNKELSELINQKVEKIIVKNKIMFNMQEFFDLDYGCFWIENVYYSTINKDNEVYCEMTIKYHDYTSEEIAYMKRQIDNEIIKIIAKVPANTDLWETSLIVHDELCKLITYDKSLNLKHTHDLYGALVNHNAVCSAYSSAFYHIMKRMGNNAYSSYSDDHAWNRLVVPSSQQYLDSTWDDLDTNDMYGNPYILHDYFFLSLEEVSNIDSHTFKDMVPGELVMKDDQNYNYHKHLGYYLNNYDYDSLTNIFKFQYSKGDNVLTVRFENNSDYQRCLSLKDNDFEGLNIILTQIGCFGRYYVNLNDNIQTFNVLLYAGN